MSKILVIDDEKSIRSSLRDILEYEKYSVEEAEDGVEALKMIKGGNYDAVLCDIKMPKMDGIEVLDKIISDGYDFPVVMISGHGNIDT
ncbi:MAG TPA: response regulator, partial [Flavobacteriales bacterium]|nr:response regulator [Flavobacteriales bacterium]